MQKKLVKVDLLLCKIPGNGKILTFSSISEMWHYTEFLQKPREVDKADQKYKYNSYKKTSGKSYGLFFSFKKGILTPEKKFG